MTARGQKPSGDGEEAGFVQVLTVSKAGRVCKSIERPAENRRQKAL